MSFSIFYFFILLSICSTISTGESGGGNSRPLSRPQLELCLHRKKHLNYAGHGYMLSWLQSQEIALDWLDSRNYCRERCMDTVAIETKQEWEFLKKHIYHGATRFSGQPVESIWTSGRLCDFDGCEKAPHVKPVAINGWFWSANNKRMSPTTCISGIGKCFHSWSNFGFFGFPQPDNRELRYDGLLGNESCLAIINGTGIEGNHGDPSWHDRACYHSTHFICEDSATLIKYVERKYRIKLTDHSVMESI